MSTNHPRHSPPNRSVPRVGPTSSLELHFKTVTASLHSLIQSLSTSSSTRSDELIYELDQLALHLVDFEQLVSRADPEGDITRLGEREGRWRDELDALGTQLWNTSTLRKYGGGHVEAQEKHKLQLIVAKLRHLSFQLIADGVVDETDGVRASLLNLATKAALAYIQLPLKPDLVAAQSLILRGVELADQLPSAESLPRNGPHLPSSEVAKALVGYYCARALVGTLNGSDVLVAYSLTKAKELAESEVLGRNEYEKLGQTIHDTGKLMLTQARSLRSQAEQIEDELEKADKAKKAAERTERAIEWLGQATELLEKIVGPTKNASTDLLCSALRLLVQANLEKEPPDPVSAEATLEVYLSLDPSVASLHRRCIKLIHQRNGPEEQLVEAFGRAVRAIGWKQDDCVKLMSELYHVSLDRPELKFRLLNELVDGVAERLDEMPAHPPTSLDPSNDIGYGPMLFLGALIQTTMFSIANGQVAELKAILDKIDSHIHGRFALAEIPAFILATYAWREGDRSSLQKREREAVDWYLLASHPVTIAIKDVVWDKANRKAGLALTELGLWDEAEEILTRHKQPEPDARTEFVRFHNFATAKRLPEAKGALRLMVSSSQFEPNMLLWSSDIAQKVGSLDLQNAVLKALLELSRTKTNLEVDTDVLVRCLVRTTYSRVEKEPNSMPAKHELGKILLEYLTAGLNLARHARDQPDPNPDRRKDEDEQVKNIRWLYTIGHAFVTKCAYNDWPDSFISNSYQVVADLMELHLKIKQFDEGKAERDVRSRVWLCRFGAIADKARRAKNAEDDSCEQRAAYGELLKPLQTLRIALSAAKREDPTIENVEDLQAALIGMQVEGSVITRDWNRVDRLIANFQAEQGNVAPDVLKQCALRAMDHPLCPPEIVLGILKNVYRILDQTEGLSTYNVAVWLRLLINHCLNRGLDADALTFTNEAVCRLRADPAGYTKDEMAWIATTAFEHGQALMRIDRQCTGGFVWCAAGARAGQVAELPWAEQMDPDGVYADQGEGQEQGELELEVEEEGEGEGEMGEDDELLKKAEQMEH